MWRGPWGQSIEHIIDWSKVDWGNAPGWVTVVIAAGALVAASLSARANIRGNRNQQKQLEFQQHQIWDQQKQLNQAKRDKRREQASKVAAWYYELAISDGPQPRWLALTQGFIKITNSSDVPIYHAVVWAHEIEFDKQIGRGFVEPVVPPGGKDVPFNLPDPTSERVFVSVLFDDAQGVTWYRDGLGGLSEQEEDMKALRGVDFR